MLFLVRVEKVRPEEHGLCRQPAPLNQSVSVVVGVTKYIKEIPEGHTIS
jgi:hypothetical protein